MKKLALIFALLLTFSFVAPAFAHATVVECAPAIGANLLAPPAQLVCRFTDPLDAGKSVLNVLDAQGQRVDRDDTRVDPNDATRLIITLDPARMPTGVYTVRWTVLSVADKDETQGQFVFGVRTQIPPTPTPLVPGAARTAAPSSATDLSARFMIGLGAALLGAIAFLLWRNRRGAQVEVEDE